jgi:hypothetical protein
VALAATLVAAVAAMGAVALAQEEPTPPPPAPMEGAVITDAGWWNRLRPEAALPIGQPAPPPTPGVPPGSLVVSASVGDPDAIAAVGIDPESPDGAAVETFELTLREVADEGANLNTTFAAVVACPITGFWIGGENAVWETRPDFDCSLGEAPGTRAEDGTWTFDLRAIGQQWSDGAVDPEGVVIVEKVEPPTAFRTVFAGLGDLAIGVRLVTSGGDEPDDPFGSGFGGGTTGSGTGSGTSGGGGTSGGFRPPSSTGTPTPPAAGAPTTTAPVADDETALPTVPIGTGPGSPLGTLQWWTWPMLLIVLGVALAAMFALGPLGEPVAVTSGRGVTRALEARAETEEP